MWWEQTKKLYPARGVNYVEQEFENCSVDPITHTWPFLKPTGTGRPRWLSIPWILLPACHNASFRWEGPRIHSSISREAIEQQLAWVPPYGRTGMVREKFMPIPSLSCLYLGKWRMRDISPSPLASSRHARIIRQPARCQLPE